MTPGPILPRDAQNKWRESTDAQTHSPQLWRLDTETLSVLLGTEVGGGPLSAHCVLPLQWLLQKNGECSFHFFHESDFFGLARIHTNVGLA